MNKDKLILKNETVIELEAGASLSDIRVLFSDKQSMIAAWDALNEENLSEVAIQNGDGLIVGKYENLVLESETSAPCGDRAIATSFRLRKKTEMEKRMDAVESSQEMQNGAIDDLGAITSVLAEALEGEV